MLPHETRIINYTMHREGKEAGRRSGDEEKVRKKKKQEEEDNVKGDCQDPSYGIEGKLGHSLCFLCYSVCFLTLILKGNSRTYSFRGVKLQSLIEESH